MKYLIILFIYLIDVVISNSTTYKPTTTPLWDTSSTTISYIPTTPPWNTTTSTTRTSYIPTTPPWNTTMSYIPTTPPWNTTMSYIPTTPPWNTTMSYIPTTPPWSTTLPPKKDNSDEIRKIEFLFDAIAPDCEIWKEEDLQCEDSCSLPLNCTSELSYTTLVNVTNFNESSVQLLIDTDGLNSEQRLIISDYESNMEIILNCLSNMQNNKFLYIAASGLMKITLLNNVPMDDANTTLQCKLLQSGVAEFLAINKTEGNNDNEIMFPNNGQILPSTGYAIELRVNVTEEYTGFGVNVTVNTNLNGEYDDVLILNPGLEYDSQTSLILSWINNDTELRFLNRDSFHLKLNLGIRLPGDPSMDGINFGLKYGSYEPFTTPAPTETPTEPLPTPHPDESISDSAVVYVTGVTTNELINNNSLLEQLKMDIAGMANEYCYEQNIQLRDNVTTRNVDIKPENIYPCLPTWPNANECSSILLRVPVYTLNTSIYELTEQNILIMWETKASQHLTAPLEKGSKPEVLFGWWIGISFAILIILMIVILIVWRLEIYIRLKSYEKAGSVSGSGGSNGYNNNPDYDYGGPFYQMPPFLISDTQVAEKKEIFSEYEEYRDSTNDGIVNEGFVHDEFDSSHDTSDDEEIVQAIPPQMEDTEQIYDIPEVVTTTDLRGTTNSETAL